MEVFTTDYDDRHSVCGSCGCGPCACEQEEYPKTYTIYNSATDRYETRNYPTGNKSMNTAIAPNADCSICQSRGSVCWVCERDAIHAMQSRDYTERGIIRNLADFETATSLWTGGHERIFYSCDEDGSIDGSSMCQSCVQEELEHRAEYGEGSSVTMDDYGYRMEVSNEDTGLYGGQTCDQCHQYIVEPTCAECGDNAAGANETDNVVLFRTSGDMMMHLSCAAKLVGKGIASRVPGKGIEVSYARQRETIAAPGSYTYKG